MSAKTGRSLPTRAMTIGRPGSYAQRDKIAKARAEGVDVLQLSGAPHGGPPKHVLEAAAVAVYDNAPVPSNGRVELREAIARKLHLENRITADPQTQILVTNAGMHALNVAMMSLLDPEDEVVIPAPTFFYDGIVTLAGGVPVYVQMSAQEGFRLDFDRLEASIGPRTRALLLCTPGNPSGHVVTHQDVEQLATLCEKHDLWLISDESYEKIVFDDSIPISPASHPSLSERTVTIHSFTKSYALGAWRIGYIVATERAVSVMHRMLEWSVLRCNHVSQAAATAALVGPQDWVASIREDFQANRDILIAAMDGLDGTNFNVPAGNPSLFLAVPNQEMTTEDFSDYLLFAHGIPTVPGGAFGTDGFVRLQFGGTTETIRELANRLTTALPIAVNDVSIEPAVR